jgi:hypothetical protein
VYKALKGAAQALPPIIINADTPAIIIRIFISTPVIQFLVEVLEPETR